MEETSIKVKLVDFTNIGHFIFVERNRLKVSQQTLADRAGYSRLTLQKIESGKLPSTTVLTSFLGALGVECKIAIL